MTTYNNIKKYTGKIVTMKEGQRYAVPGGWLQWVQMTPALAAEMLSHLHPNQRNLRGRSAAQLASALTEDRWYLDMAPIRVDTKFLVIDGQHRLMGIKEAGGAGVPLFIAIVVDERVFFGMDQQIPRSQNDIRATLGKTSLTAGYRGAVLLEDRKFKARTRQWLSKEETEAILDAFPFHDEVAQLYATARASKNGRAVSGAVAAAIACMRGNRVEALKFFKSVLSLDSTVDGVRSMPALLLIQFLSDTSGGRTSGERYLLESAHKCVRAWNAYRTGEDIVQLRYRAGAPMPIPEL